MTCRCKHRRSKRRCRGARRGVVTLLLTGLIAVGLLLASWVLSREQLRLLEQDMQGHAQAMALAAAPELLDVELLQERAGNQADDVSTALHVASDALRSARDNACNQALAQYASHIRPGYVGSVERPEADAFKGERSLYNALEVQLTKPIQGSPGLKWLSLWTQGKGQVSVSARAVLDNRLVGFRAQAERNAPVSPVAVDVHAWWGLRGPDLYPSASSLPFSTGAGNGIREVVLTLGGDESSTALVSWTGPLHAPTVLAQAERGVRVSETAAGRGELGPISATALPLVLTGDAHPGFDLQALAQRLLKPAATGQSEIKAFPVYDSLDERTKAAQGQFRVVGFVAARVVNAEVQQGRMVLALEPAFLVHPTAWTEPWASEGNRYIYNLRLVR